MNCKINERIKQNTNMKATLYAKFAKPNQLNYKLQNINMNYT